MCICFTQKNIFDCISEVYFSLCFKRLEPFSFLLEPNLERSRVTVWEQNKSFVFKSTLRKKVFSGAPVKCFSPYGSNNSDSVVFLDVASGEIKDHSLRTKPCQKKV